MKKCTIAAAVMLSLGGTGFVQTAQAATLANGLTLTINPGVEILDANGNKINVSPGSWFGMDTQSNQKIAGGEKTALSMGTTGLVIGVTTTQGASHPGAILPGDTNAITAPWRFAGNTGSDYMRVAPTGSTTNGLDFSGWTVTWNSIPAIDMSTGAWIPLNCADLGITNCSFTNAIANIECFTDSNFTTPSASCSAGEYYKLNYAATVPVGDPSNFGNTRYLLHLEGQIFAEPLGTGVTFAGAPNSTPPTDSAMARQCVGGCFTFTQTLTTGTWLYEVLPLTEAIPTGATFRKHINGAWTNFATGTDGTLKSAPGTGTDGTPATCPAYNDAAYTSGLTAGNRCVRLGIKDGGANDADGATNSSVTDPGGIGVPAGSVLDLSSSKTSGGCSLTGSRTSAIERGDWWIVAGFLAWLGALRIRFKRQAQS